MTNIPAGNLTNLSRGWVNLTATDWSNLSLDDWSSLTVSGSSEATGSTLTATYDAWNRLVKLVDSDTDAVVQENEYDARTFRIATSTSAELRHYYYTPGWRCVEERLNSSTEPERQFVWGLRYIDDLILRDRDTDSDDIVDERLYALQDANWNVIALADSEGAIQERFAYSPYGVPTVLAADFSFRGEEEFDWETTYCGYRWDAASGMYAVRFRNYQPDLAVWVQQDPIEYAAKSANLMQYVLGNPLKHLDQYGLQEFFPEFSYEGSPPLPIISAKTPTTTRMYGFLDIVFGLLETGAGVTLATGGGVGTAGTLGTASPVTVPVLFGGVALSLHGIDTVYAGGVTLYNGVRQRTTTSQGLDFVTNDPRLSDALDASIGGSGDAIARLAVTRMRRCDTVSLYSYTNSAFDPRRGGFTSDSGGRVYMTTRPPGPWLTAPTVSGSMVRFVTTGRVRPYQSPHIFTTGLVSPAEMGFTPIPGLPASFWKPWGSQYQTYIGVRGFELYPGSNSLITNTPIGANNSQIRWSIGGEGLQQIGNGSYSLIRPVISLSHQDRD